jgi:hypothetical protein
LVESAKRVRAKIHSAGYHEVYCDHINTVFQRTAADAAQSGGQHTAAA